MAIPRVTSRPGTSGHALSWVGQASPIAISFALLLPMAGVAQPVGRTDANWPCQQIKVPELSLAAVWSGPAISADQDAWRNDAQVVELVAQVAPRREPIDQAGRLIHEFAQRAAEQKQQRLLGLLAGVFSVLSDERDSVMTGLDRSGLHQKELAAELRDSNEKLHAMQSDPEVDAAAIQQLTRQVTWEAEVFQERRQALSYACDVPGKIEQRLFALAHQIQHEME